MARRKRRREPPRENAGPVPPRRSQQKVQQQFVFVRPRGHEQRRNRKSIEPLFHASRKTIETSAHGSVRAASEARNRQPGGDAFNQHFLRPRARPPSPH
jgi:hypothetical protein